MNGRTVAYRSTRAARHSASSPPSSPAPGGGSSSRTASTAAARSSRETTCSTAAIISGSDAGSCPSGRSARTTAHAAAIRAAAVFSLGKVFSFSLLLLRAAPDSSFVDISRSNSSRASSTEERSSCRTVATSVATRRSPFKSLIFGALACSP